jgi:hypothetical protein
MKRTLVKNYPEWIRFRRTGARPPNYGEPCS